MTQVVLPGVNPGCFCLDEPPYAAGSSASPVGSQVQLLVDPAWERMKVVLSPTFQDGEIGLGCYCILKVPQGEHPRDELGVVWELVSSVRVQVSALPGRLVYGSPSAAAKVLLNGQQVQWFFDLPVFVIWSLEVPGWLHPPGAEQLAGQLRRDLLPSAEQSVEQPVFVVLSVPF